MAPVRTTLAGDRFFQRLKNTSVYAVDRRGRGASGDSDEYAIEREFEDIAAVVDSIGPPVNYSGTRTVLCAL